MKTRAALLFAFALLCLGSLANAAADTAAPAPATLPALAGFSTTMSLAPPPDCGGSSSLPDILNLSPGGGFSPRVLICGICSDSACVGAAANATCGVGRKCFIITDCARQPGTWRCTCSNIDP
ncbi:MAG TPA: hypothetical protein VGS07_04025 [Thermoanaerobaculia bacterium]|jgi:hypothetical protein|nr:hypothetical protein [Thermoanaerobaculia bacterium]